jgi:hypothetical protein
MRKRLPSLNIPQIKASITKQAAKNSHALLPRSTGGRFISWWSATLSRDETSNVSIAMELLAGVALMMGRLVNNAAER